MNCPLCGKPPIQSAVCYKHNPIGECHLAKRSVRHLHHYCSESWPHPKHQWIEVIKEDYEIVRRN